MSPPRKTKVNEDNETVDIETVTPELAQEWLEGNVDNRRLRDTRVLNLAGILQRGEWELTDSAIVFDDQGVLINGQHRLTAIVVAGIPARILVLRGVPAKAQEVMDQGLGRNLGDQLHRRGVAYSTIIASALQWLYRINFIEETGNVHYPDPSFRPSLRQLLALYDQHTELPDRVTSLNKLRYYLKIRQGPTLAIQDRLLNIDASDTDIFFKSWEEGTGLAKTDPIWRLREWCLQDARTRTTQGRAPDYRYVAYVFKAWNHWREGQPISRLNWVFSSTKREPWPVPH